MTSHNANDNFVRVLREIAGDCMAKPGEALPGSERFRMRKNRIGVGVVFSARR